MATYKLYGPKKAYGLVLLTAKTLGAAIADAVVTSVTLTAGGGADFASASAIDPHKIEVESERMYVTGRAADVLTVQRGKDSTTAAAHANGLAVKHARPVRIPKTNRFTIAADRVTLEFPGDADVEELVVASRIGGELEMSKFDTDLMVYLAGVPAVVAGIFSDEASRYLAQEGTYPNFELHVNLKAKNEATGANGTIRRTIWLAQLQDPVVPGDAANLTAQLTNYAWTSTATLKDIFDRAIGGATEDVHFAESVLA